MNTKVLAVLLVALQCGVLLTQAARPLGEEASHGSLRKVLRTSASHRTETSAISDNVDGYAGAGVEVYGENSNIFGSSTANSETISIAENAIAKATSVAIAEVRGGGKAVAAAEAAAKATGTAIAKAEATTFVKIVSDGKNNKGCGVAKADAKANAKAFALAIAKAFAEARNYKAEAIVKAEVAAIQVVYVKAVADSLSVACLKGKGFAKAEQSSFAHAAAKIYVGVYAKALAAVKGPASGGSVVAAGGGDSDQVANVGGSNKSVVDGEGFASGVTFSDAFVDYLYP